MRKSSRLIDLRSNNKHFHITLYSILINYCFQLIIISIVLISLKATRSSFIMVPCDSFLGYYLSHPDDHNLDSYLGYYLSHPDNHNLDSYLGSLCLGPSCYLKDFRAQISISSQFLEQFRSKFEPRCSYKIVRIKRKGCTKVHSSLPRLLSNYLGSLAPHYLWSDSYQTIQGHWLHITFGMTGTTMAIKI